MARKRVIYQSEGLYVGCSSGSDHTEDLEAGGGAATVIARNGARPQQLHRIQSINYGFDIPRQDVNQFGQLARIDQVILEQPTVDLDFTYYTETGFNEGFLGFHVGAKNALSHFISGNIGKIPGHTDLLPGSNFYIRTSQEGDDLNIGTANVSVVPGAGDKVIGIGNAFITNYTTEASVGGFPTTSITAEGLNMKFYGDGTGVVGGVTSALVPSISPTDGQSVSSDFALPDAAQGTTDMPTALRPGSVAFGLKLKDHVDSDKALWRGLDAGELKIQSFSISADMSRENLERLGSKFAYSKELEFPLTATLTLEAIVSDQLEDDLENIINGTDATYDIVIKIYGPDDTTKTSATAHAIGWKMAGLKTDSLSFSSSIGDNKTVSLTATAQIGAADDTANGLFIAASGVSMAL